MVLDPLSVVPAAIRAGTTIKLRRSFADFPTSEGWAYKFILAGQSTLSADGTIVNAAFEVTLAADKTAPLAPGNYNWQEITSLLGEKHIAAQGHLKVERDLEAAAPGDAQSHEARMVPVIESVLEGRFADGIEAYMIGGRSVTKIPINELRKILVRYKQVVWRQRNPGRLGQRAQVTFKGAS